MYNFDEPLDRRGQYTVKYDGLKQFFGRDDLVPLWVADMEFRSAPCIQESLRKLVEHGNFGYNIEPPELKQSIISWLKERQLWSISPEWLTYIPGIVRGISFAIHYFTRKGDKILVQPPIYHPFMLVPMDNDREIIFNPMRRTEPIETGKSAHSVYSMDFENLEKTASENDIKMMILCNPHNPGGVNWSAEDLAQLAEICHRHKIIVISDEIHADLTLWGGKHIPFASASTKAAEISITFGAPSKTFNIPGLSSSFAVIPNPELREGFYQWLTVNEYNVPMIAASVATIAAYTEGNEWREECIKYIEGNILFTEEFFRTNLPSVKVIRPQASYLVWLDCREFAATLSGCTTEHLDTEVSRLLDRYGVSTPSQKILCDYFTNTARLALNDGSIFGPQGNGFLRLNVACTRKMLSDALARLIK